jgi:hypothetical protein
VIAPGISRRSERRFATRTCGRTRKPRAVSDSTETGAALGSVTVGTVHQPTSEHRTSSRETCWSERRLPFSLRIHSKGMPPKGSTAVFAKIAVGSDALAERVGYELKLRARQREDTQRRDVSLDLAASALDLTTA